GPNAETDVDVDGDGVPDEAPTDFMVHVDFDCLTVNNNRAVISGVINQSSQPRLIGNRVLLIVQDNGEGQNQPEPDRVTWGVYKRAVVDWIPVDAERPDDDGASLTWIATDAERPDDPGIPSRRDQTIGCNTFSFVSYA